MRPIRMDMAASTLNITGEELAVATREVLSWNARRAQDTGQFLKPPEYEKIQKHFEKRLDLFAKALNLEIAEVMRVASHILEREEHTPLAADTFLDAEEYNSLKEYFKVRTQQPAAPVLAPIPADRIQSGPLTFRALHHDLWIHPEVLTAMTQHGLGKRLNIVLQHLSVQGKTSNIKSCQGQQNQGWLRSPLGGNNGMQFYLWWTAQGHPPVQGLPLNPGEILIRSVRGHDDHRHLEAGALEPYQRFERPDFEADQIEQPWTAPQLKFIEAQDPVRILVGRPGSGKTTVLWRAIEARPGQRVLYLTWSRELTRQASERFKAFAPADVEVVARDFLTFLGEICGTDIPVLTQAESLTRFRRAIGAQTNALGPWKDYKPALFAEIRAFLIGAAIPTDAQSEGVLPRLEAQNYRQQRGQKEGIGTQALEALLSVAQRLSPDTLADVFPELMAAANAIQRLKQGKVSAGLLNFDRIVVDEVQDLTLLETSVVITLCQVMGARRGHAPWLLVAGDDGQTVRPSGFHWGRTKDLIAQGVAKPREFQLEENLRCPDKIARVLERASAKYKALERRNRPTAQGHHNHGQHVDAHLIYVSAGSQAEAEALLRDLQSVQGLVLLLPHSEPCTWIPADLRDLILTPAEAKGLEYQSVVVLETGKRLRRFEDIKQQNLDLEEQARRTMLDQLRVALSRATETLVFIDIAPEPVEQTLSLELLGQPMLLNPQELRDHFKTSDQLPEDIVRSRIEEARQLIDHAPQQAWRRACQAMRRLGNRHLPNGVAAVDVRREVAYTLLSLAARLLIDGLPATLARGEVVTAAEEALAHLSELPDSEVQPHAEVFAQLNQWSEQKSSAPIPLLEAIHRLGTGGAWVRQALPGAAQTLRQKITESAHQLEWAGAFVGQVSSWLQLTGFVGTLEAETQRLRARAFDTLLAAQALPAAESLLACLEPQDLRRTAQLREAQRQYEAAAEIFETITAPEDALRNWRQAANWQRARDLIARTHLTNLVNTRDLNWLLQLETLIAQRPEGLSKRLSAGERKRLQALSKQLTEGTPIG